ncbi:MAG TPA: hypothetical protein DCG51_08550, partial [Erysipelotrichaceae bacterium]|nr:hypothetical protein [Erysipelotrichaceae bacterium]
MVWFLMILILILSSIAGWQFLERRKEKKRIAALSDYLSRVQDHAELPKVEEAYEGELQILQSEIYKTANILQMEFSFEQEKNRLLKELLTNV